jgi:DNA repair ATPase RecN
MPDVTPPLSDEFGRVLVLLEDIRAQNKATIEAVESGRRETSLEIQRLEARLTARIEILEAVVRHHSEELRGIRLELTALKATVNNLESKVDRLLALEARVTAIERRGA